MNKELRDAIANLLFSSQLLSDDQNGFIQCLSRSHVAKLQFAYDKHCRKHGLKVVKAIPKKALAAVQPMH